MKKNVLSFLPLFTLIACSSEAEPSFYSNTLYDVFHSFVSYSYDSDKDSINEEIDSFLVKMDALSDPYEAAEGKSNLFTINSTHLPVKVDEDLFDLVQTSLSLEEKTEGYFDPLLGTITSLWKNLLQSDSPTQEDLDALEAKLPSLLEERKSSSLVLNEAEKSIQRLGEAKIDLGGLVKGYCIERVQKMVLEAGATRYLINGGTSSLALGKTKTGGEYRVSLRDSKVAKQNRFRLSNIDTSTSAIYEQRIQIGGQTYSHVINPKTGMAVSPYSMAFLAGEDSALLDAFSTSCMLAGEAKTKQWGSQYGFSYSLYQDEGGYASLAFESEDLTAVRIPLSEE